MWIVWSNEEGLVISTDNYEEALNQYEEQKQWYKDTFDGEFTLEEHVILAKIEKQFYSKDTKEPVYEIDENGEEVETDITYGDWEESKF